MTRNPIRSIASITAEDGAAPPVAASTTWSKRRFAEAGAWTSMFKTIGELMLRSNTLMKGYLANPAATGEAFADGWFHTGDLAVMHEDGYIEIKDRSKDIIISGGENISSIEVEEVLYRHPMVMEAAVVAKPDDTWGESPCAFVTLKPDAGEIAAADIIAWCRANLAHYKVPKTIVFGPLPKTSTGKIQKYALRERAKEAP